MNSVNIIGRITCDIEIKITENGFEVCSFGVAVRRTNDITDFIPCVAWRKNAVFISQHFAKGDNIGITGLLQSRKYKDRQGNNRTAVELIVSSASFCEPSKRAAVPCEAESEVSTDEDLPL